MVEYNESLHKRKLPNKNLVSGPVTQTYNGDLGTSPQRAKLPTGRAHGQGSLLAEAKALSLSEVQMMRKLSIVCSYFCS